MGFIYSFLYICHVENYSTIIYKLKLTGVGESLFNKDVVEVFVI